MSGSDVDEMTVRADAATTWSLLLPTMDGQVAEIPLVGGLTMDGGRVITGVMVRCAGIRARNDGEEPQDLPGPWLAEVEMQPEEYTR